MFVQGAARGARPPPGRGPGPEDRPPRLRGRAWRASSLACFAPPAMRCRDMTVDQLRPVELALTEFLAASLAELTSGRRVRRRRAVAASAPDLPKHRDPATQSRSLAAQARRQERRLAALYPEALRLGRETLSAITCACGASSAAGWICASPLCARLSISEICFRWGFNELAHFSRAFRNQYGLSPREYPSRCGPDALGGRASVYSHHRTGDVASARP